MQPRERPSGIQTFGDPSLPPRTPKQPLNLLFLTSIRDTGNCDSNGSIIRTEEGLRYMEGIVERTINETREGGSLHGILRVVGVVNDDLDRDMAGSRYPVAASKGRQWIFNEHLNNIDGSPMIKPPMSVHIPSDFRALPKDAIEHRADRKMHFETSINDLMEERNVDVLVSDHYMARIAYLMNSALGKYGRILNIHPAVTIENHPNRFAGKTPTADAIAAARLRKIHTGATLHIVDEIIDHGPALAYIAETPVHADDAPQNLRYRNYQMGKLPLFIAGIRHYVERIFPYLDTIDLRNLSPLAHGSRTSPAVA